jgi:outer membrane immunogenic protein
MKKAVFTALMLAALHAAPAAAQQPAPFNWSGFYLGGHAGGDWANDGISVFVNPVGLGGPNNALLRQLGSRDVVGRSAIGGMQAGYDWQVRNIVFGLEGDVSALHAGGTAMPSAGCPGYGTGTCTYSENFNETFLATLRPRLGVAFERTLIYATGGLAVARWSTADTLTISGAPPPASTSGSKTAAGWTVGGGVAYGWTDCWLLGIEYLFADLGRTNTATPSSGPFNGGANADNHFQQHLTNNLVRLNLSYRFGSL